jgi:hypothetical protein
MRIVAGIVSAGVVFYVVMRIADKQSTPDDVEHFPTLWSKPLGLLEALGNKGHKDD